MRPDPPRDRSRFGWRLLVFTTVAMAVFRAFAGDWPLPHEPLSLMSQLFFLGLSILASAAVGALVMSVIPALVYTRLGAHPIHAANQRPLRSGWRRAVRVWVGLFVITFGLMIAANPTYYQLLLEMPGSYLTHVLWVGARGVALLTAPVAILVALMDRDRMPRLSDRQQNRRLAVTGAPLNGRGEQGG